MTFEKQTLSTTEIDAVRDDIRRYNDLALILTDDPTVPGGVHVSWRRPLPGEKPPAGIADVAARCKSKHFNARKKLTVADRDLVLRELEININRFAEKAVANHKLAKFLVW